jgi:Ni,Fe-hydrogenase III large subunit
MMKYSTILNNQTILLQSIPVLKYEDLLELNTKLVQRKELHCVNYYGFILSNKIKLICCVANDAEHTIYISSAEIERNGLEPKPSLTARHLSFHIFEREIHENFGINYTDHPWLKPLRYAFDRTNRENGIENYPFYAIHSEELHEVGVGPIHAGIIEPGHFRFICNGEQILHLEVQLGYQHRGIEALFLNKKKILERITLAESIAGDTVVGHTTAFVNVWESLIGFNLSQDLLFARTLALELERLAIHTGDLSAICNDIAYQLGSSVFGRLRTPIINFMQEWCGNRLSKGLIRVGKNNFPFTQQLAQRLIYLLDAYEPDFIEMYNEMKSLPTVLARLEKTGVVTLQQSESIGTVGMSARTSGIPRDIRSSHPSSLFAQLNHKPLIKNHGDVYSRSQIRKEEIIQSIGYIRKWLQNIPEAIEQTKELQKPTPNSFTVSLIEGWRGEICHCAVTDETGELLHYKVKDPSMHNWLAVALAVRNNEISDFPICNKSFDLSYCGHDL